MADFEQTERAIIEGRAIGYAFQRLGREANPKLSWRCASVGDAIIEAIDAAFPETVRAEQ